MRELQKAITRLMAERPDRAPTGLDPPVLRSALQLLEQRVTASEWPLVEPFARALFERDGAGTVTANEPEVMAAVVLNAFRWWHAERVDSPRVRAFVPTTEREGWTSPFVTVETMVSDRPFIVDTLLEAVRHVGGEVRLLLHPILGVRRDEEGRATAVTGPAGVTTRESFVHMELACAEPPSALEVMLAEHLRAVVLSTDDYAAMRARVADLVAELKERRLPAPWGDQAGEAAEFLTWLGERNFVFLGYREYEISGHGSLRQMCVRTESGLGILRDAERSRYRVPRRFDEEQRRQLNEPPLLVVVKTSAVSPVHRLVPMDYIGLKQVDGAGIVVTERRLLGLFTSKAYHEPSSLVPVLRGKLESILDQESIVAESHDYRDLVGLFDSFPKEELLASPTGGLRDALRDILATEGQSALRVLARPDRVGRGWFVIVTLPRLRFSTELAQRVTTELERRLDGKVLNQRLALDDRLRARLHYYVAPRMFRVDQLVAETLERHLALLLRTWEEQLGCELATSRPPGEAERLAARYEAAFPPAYKAGTPVAEAVRDIWCLERLLSTGEPQIEFRKAASGHAPELCELKLFLAAEEIVLSDFIPVLENLGFRVHNEEFVDLSFEAAERVRIHTFLVRDAGDPPGDPVGAAPRLVPALHALRAGRLDSDPLNSLILRAGLEWRAVEVLRAYVEHARQTGVAARPATVIEALRRHPESARRLFEIFAAKFDPAASRLTPEERLHGPVARAQADFLASLERVDSLVFDRILRALANTVSATVRTNFYVPPSGGSEARAVAIKLTCAEIEHLPQPRPMFETYVHAAHMEGIHLRGGRVARGGIRLSDRPDDFRTEILGLMKTQVAKNAVIVPVGAKGGFIVKGHGTLAPPPAEVEHAYRTLVGALLSLTDNVQNGLVVTPRGILVYDGPDPYLVVAADKGTASLSDTANAVAELYGYWLADAFASGGSKGYDHKALGITARGAWECVRQHFREMGRDVDNEPISVIGIGDMSGDVFGNGLLRSRKLRLLAAFDHRHIFLDPDPDPEASCRERERLFRLPRSAWDDYDRSVLSEGGGVYPRSAKAIDLSGAAGALLGIETSAPSGEEVIRAILRMDVDLLWNGGIGTYVKAADELDSGVGDPANDAVRVNAGQLRVRVVGEGGNLGFTQRARIEFALAGGRINTDAIDNSGGVDLSDHEVNLKIALQPALMQGTLSPEERGALLMDLADEVCASVLAHNRRQALVLALDQRRSRTDLATFRRLMEVLAVEAGLDRQLEELPTREALRSRRGTFLGLTRPELAVLLAHAKLDLQRRILDSALCEDAAAAEFFELYFPARIPDRFGAALRNHQLRREITAVAIANWLIDSMGMTFLVRISGHTGSDPAEIVSAWAAVARIVRLRELLNEIDAARLSLSAEAEAQCHLAVADGMERATKWMLETQAPPESIAEPIELFAEPVRRLLSVWPELLDGDVAARHQADVARLSELGVPGPLAEGIVRLGAASDALEIAHIARELDLPLPLVTEAYLRAVELVDVDWVRCSLLALAGSDDRWEQRAVEGLLEGLIYARRRLTANVLEFHQGRREISDCLADYAAQQRIQLDEVQSLIADLKVVAQPPLASLLVVMRELGRLVGR